MSDSLLKDRTIVLGVTGGIAAYKTAYLASRLTQAGALVNVVMTEAAARFVTPMTFQALTHRPVYSDMFDIPPGENIPHVTLGKQCDLLVIAPATANTIAKLAYGIADNLLCAIVLAGTSPVLLAPAMESQMWLNPMTQHNISMLEERGFNIISPESGLLASGASGPGRMAEPEEIMEHIRWLLGSRGDLSGRKIVITAGGTRERIDPVRYISNFSSGKMGNALATAARDRGAQVTLVSAAALPAPVGIRVVAVESAAQMRDAVLMELPAADALIMAAAVADYRPRLPERQKIKKNQAELVLPLERTSDILQETAEFRRQTGRPKVVIGFAAETEDLLAHAREKLERKNLDLIAANDVSEASSVFGADTNRVSLLGKDGSIRSLPLLSKQDVAHEILDELAVLLAAS